MAFSHHDFSHFSPTEHAAWVGGRWNHGWHNGHFGWWWFAGGAWFFYDEPIYPYPGYVSDEYYVEDDYGPGGPTWWYCQNPPGYYPYVQNCMVPWQPVPASPPPPPAGGYGPPPGYGGPAPNGDQGGPPPDEQGPPPGGPGNQNPPPPPQNGPNN